MYIFKMSFNSILHPFCSGETFGNKGDSVRHQMDCSIERRNAFPNFLIAYLAVASNYKHSLMLLAYIDPISLLEGFPSKELKTICIGIRIFEH